MWERGSQGDIDQETGKCSSSMLSLQYKIIPVTPSSQADNSFISGVDFSGCQGALSSMTAPATVPASHKFFARYQTPCNSHLYAQRQSMRERL